MRRAAALTVLGLRVAYNAGLVAATERVGRPWLGLSLIGDVTDIAWTYLGRAEVPGDAPRKTALVAGGSVLLTLAVAVLVDE